MPNSDFSNVRHDDFLNIDGNSPVLAQFFSLCLSFFRCDYQFFSLCLPVLDFFIATTKNERSIGNGRHRNNKNPHLCLVRLSIFLTFPPAYLRQTRTSKGFRVFFHNFSHLVWRLGTKNLTLGMKNLTLQHKNPHFGLSFSHFAKVTC